MNAGRYDVIAALTHIDIVIWMHIGAELFACQAGDNLIGIHVGAGAGAGLEDVDGELLVVGSLCDG